MNKIKGQSDTEQPTRAKNAGAETGREEWSPIITSEMIAVCADVLRESGRLKYESESAAESLAWEVLDAVRAVFAPRSENS